MAELDEQQILLLLENLMSQVREDERLEAEVHRAQREFRSFDRLVMEARHEGDPLGKGSAAIRFAEWFLIERESDLFGEVPLQRLRLPSESREALADSVVGVFLLLESSSANHGPEEQAGLAVQVQDLQSDEVLDLIPLAALQLQAGDLLVGRLYPDSFESHRASPAMALQRGADTLAEAFRTDVAALGIDRRLTQAELEHLLFRNEKVDPSSVAGSDPGVPPVERVEADLQRMLRDAGLEERLHVTAISQALQEAEAPGELIGQILDEIAFNSKADIREMQQQLLLLAQSHLQHAATPGTPATCRQGHAGARHRPG